MLGGTENSHDGWLMNKHSEASQTVSLARSLQKPLEAGATPPPPQKRGSRWVNLCTFVYTNTQFSIYIICLMSGRFPQAWTHAFSHAGTDCWMSESRSRTITNLVNLSHQKQKVCEGVCMPMSHLSPGTPVLKCQREDTPSDAIITCFASWSHAYSPNISPRSSKEFIHKQVGMEW